MAKKKARTGKSKKKTSKVINVHMETVEEKEEFLGHCKKKRLYARHEGRKALLQYMNNEW